jgi:hypothetical protein
MTGFDDRVVAVVVERPDSDLSAVAQVELLPTTIELLDSCGWRLILLDSRSVYLTLRCANQRRDLVRGPDWS